MGCIQSSEKEELNSTPVHTDPPPKQVDPRLPFDSYRQMFNTRNSWKTVVRAMKKTAIDMLIRHFNKYPDQKALHKRFDKLETEESMQTSMAFENAALDIFNLIDQVIESFEKVDRAIWSLEQAGQAHAKIAGFKVEYFRDMESSFIDSISNLMGDRFNDATEQNFRKLYLFVLTHMTNGYNAANGGGEGNRI